VLPPGTRRTCQAFSRCQGCGHVYRRGANAGRVQAGPVQRGVGWGGSGKFRCARIGKADKRSGS
jgi:hypothetical protein